MSGVTRFDLHMVNINKAETMDEFKQANEALALDDKYVHLSTLCFAMNID